MQASDSTRSENSWRQLCLRLAVFCLPIVLAWSALEYWATRVPPNDLYSLKHERLEAMANEVDTVIIGASSASMGVAPELLTGSAVNLANEGEDLYYTDALATQVVPRLPKLKRVIIQIHYNCLFYCISESDTAWRQSYYAQEWNIPPVHLIDWLNCQTWSRVAFRTPRFWLLNAKNVFQDWRRTGKFTPGSVETNRIDRRGREVGGETFLRRDLSPAGVANKLALIHRRSSVENERDNIKHLDHLLSVLREHNIEAVLVTLPVWHTFEEAQKADYWNETLKVVAQRTNNLNVSYYSFLSLPQFSPEDYADANHLSSRGAMRFTEMLNSALNQGKQSSDAKRTVTPTNSAL
ncbi:MAG: hypothetical protein ACXWIU_03295 [Limisphaerales bacterium]